MAKHRNFLSEKSDVLLFPVENLPKTSVPGVRYFRPVCRLLPSEALPGAFQKRLQQLMSVNLGSMKLLHTHGCLRTSGLWSVRDCRLLDTKKLPIPVRCRMGSGGGKSYRFRRTMRRALFSVQVPTVAHEGIFFTLRRTPGRSQRRKRAMKARQP